jgi:hypothetical protein
MAAMMTAAVMAADIIVTNDSKKIDAKITEISQSEIRYKDADNLDGPVFVVPISQINSVILSNGRVILYNQPTQMPEETVVTPAAEPVSTPVPEPVTRQEVEEPEGIELPYIESNVARGHQGYIEFSGFVGDAPSSILKDNTIKYTNTAIGGISLNFLYGWRFNPYVFLGVGTGFTGEFSNIKMSKDRITGTTSARAFSMPYYADLRLFVPTRHKGVYPYVELALGARCEYTGSGEVSVGSIDSTMTSTHAVAAAHFKANFGLECKRVILSLGYQLWGDKSIVYQYFNINLGIRLGKPW